MRKVIQVLIVLFMLQYGALSVCAEIAQPNMNCTICDNQKIASVQYDGVHDYTFNIQDNQGLCHDTNMNGVTLKLCDCPNIDKLSTENEYVIVLSILTKGVYFDAPTSATLVEYGYTTYATETDACTSTNATYTTTLSYAGTDAKNRVVSTPAYLMQKLSPYIVVEIPTMYYQVEEVTPSAKVIVQVSVVAPDDICPSCDDALCSCRQPVAVIGCYECSANVSYVVLNTKDWWTGIVLTNRNDTPNVCVLRLVTAENTYTCVVNLLPRTLTSKVISQYFPESVHSSDTAGYVEIQSVSRIEALCIMGSGNGVYAVPASNCCSCLK